MRLGVGILVQKKLVGYDSGGRTISYIVSIRFHGFNQIHCSHSNTIKRAFFSNLLHAKFKNVLSRRPNHNGPSGDINMSQFLLLKFLIEKLFIEKVIQSLKLT